MTLPGMHKSATPAQDKSLSLDAATGRRVAVVMVREHKHYQPGDIVDVTPGEADVLIDAGIGAAL